MIYEIRVGDIMKKAIAEFIGTFALVFIGCGTIVVGAMATGPTAITELTIALAFGLTIIAMAYGIGQISGCHVNPAVSFGVFVAGRMTLEELLTYWVAQVAGAIAAALVLYLILSGKVSGWNGGLGQTTWSEYNAASAFLFEALGTFLFLVCILGVTQPGAPVALAGIAIGLALAAIHLAGINISGSSVNPARSLGPALIGYGHNPEALKQIWLYILAPLIGAGAAGYLFRSGFLAAETVIPIRGEVVSDVPPGTSAPREVRRRRTRKPTPAARQGTPEQSD
jgi:aquaporin Z